jgi:hypothetical protein
VRGYFLHWFVWLKAKRDRIYMAVDLQNTNTPFGAPNRWSSPQKFIDSVSIIEPLDPVSGTDRSAAHNYRLPTPKHIDLPTAARTRLIPLQQWEGYVSDVDFDSRTMTVRLKDLEPNGNPHEEIAELDLDDVDPDDMELVQLGGVFRWIIGYRDQPFGKRERVSSLIFRRLPAWTKPDLDAAEVRAERLADAIRQSQSENPSK